MMKDPKYNKITLGGLIKHMKGDQSPNFVRPFVLYTIGNYLCPIAEGYVDEKYLGIIQSVHTIKGTNLAQLTLDHLMSSIRKFVGGAGKLEGNLPLLQVIGIHTII